MNYNGEERGNLVMEMSCRKKTIKVILIVIKIVTVINVVIKMMTMSMMIRLQVTSGPNHWALVL